MHFLIINLLVSSAGDFGPTRFPMPLEGFFAPSFLPAMRIPQSSILGPSRCQSREGSPRGQFHWAVFFHDANSVNISIAMLIPRPPPAMPIPRAVSFHDANSVNISIAMPIPRPPPAMPIPRTVFFHDANSVNISIAMPIPRQLSTMPIPWTISFHDANSVNTSNLSRCQFRGTIHSSRLFQTRPSCDANSENGLTPVNYCLHFG